MPGDHDIVKHEDEGFVVCRCGETFSGESDGEALARHRAHHHAETVGKPGVAAARQALEERKGE